MLCVDCREEKEGDIHRNEEYLEVEEKNCGCGRMR